MDAVCNDNIILQDVTPLRVHRLISRGLSGLVRGDVA